MDLLGLKNVTKFGPDTSKRCEKNKRLAGPDFFVYGKGFVSCNYKNPLAAKGDGSEIADRSISLLLSSDVQNSSATPTRWCQGSANAKIALSAVSPTSKNDETGAPV